MAKAKEDGTQKALQTGVRKLKELLGIARSSRADISRIDSNYGSAVRSAVEKNHLHKRAWNMAVKEDRMEPPELAAYYDALDYYRDVLGLLERANSAPSFSVIEGGKSDDGGQEAAE
jgi:hypothetical protein